MHKNNYLLNSDVILYTELFTFHLKDFQQKLKKYNCIGCTNIIMVVFYNVIILILDNHFLFLFISRTLYTAQYRFDNNDKSGKTERKILVSIRTVRICYWN